MRIKNGWVVKVCPRYVFAFSGGCAGMPGRGHCFWKTLQAEAAALKQAKYSHTVSIAATVFALIL
jgi:hypothetical protein